VGLVERRVSVAAVVPAVPAGPVAPRVMVAPVVLRVSAALVAPAVMVALRATVGPGAPVGLPVLSG